MPVLIRALKRFWWLLVLGAVTAGALSLLMLSRRTPEYEASARLFVTPIAQYDENFIGIDVLRDSQDATTTNDTASELFENTAIARLTARALGGGWTVRSVLDAVDIRPVGETRILEVAAVTRTPAEAARVADAYGETLVRERERVTARQLRARLELVENRRRRVPTDDYSQRDNLFREIRRLENALEAGDPTLSFAERAVPPTASTLTPAWLVGGMATLGGGVIGLLAALALTALTRRLRDEREVLAAFPAPVLARVPRVKDGGRKGGIPPAAMPPAAHDAFDALAVQLHRFGPPNRVVLVTSPGRADGRTTLVAALAVALADAGEMVTVIDLDGGRGRLHEMLADEGRLDNLRVMPNAQRSSRALEDQLDRAREAGGWILLDGPPVLQDAVALRASQAVDDVLVATRLGHTIRTDLEQAGRLLASSAAPVTGLLVVATAGGSGGGRGRRGRTDPAPIARATDPFDDEVAEGRTAGTGPVRG